MNSPYSVAVTGAAGNIGYSLLFRIASGEVFGKKRPIVLKLLEIPPAMSALEGVVMELNDCAFPLLREVVTTDDAKTAFDGVNRAFLVGSKPRGKGQERNDLIRDNGPIFTGQGKALNEGAASDVRIVVVGNPCNTNCLIAMHHAPDIPRDRFTAMTRLDHNRARHQLAAKAGAPVSDVTGVTIFGNHSSTQYPDFENATIGGKAAATVIGDKDWLQNEFIRTVQQRGAAIIQARGSSSAASAANAAINHMHDWEFGTPEGEWVSMAVPSDGSYGAPEDLIVGMPCTIDPDSGWSIVQGLELDDFAKGKLEATYDELRRERELVNDLL